MHGPRASDISPRQAGFVLSSSVGALSYTAAKALKSRSAQPPQEEREEGHEPDRDKDEGNGEDGSSSDRLAGRDEPRMAFH